MAGRGNPVHLFLYLDYPQFSRGHYCSACFVRTCVGMDNAGEKAQKNCPLGDANLALCQHHRRDRLLDDGTVLLKNSTPAAGPAGVFFVQLLS